MPTALAGLCALLSLPNILSLPNMSSSRSPTYLRAAAMLAARFSRVNMLAFISMQTLPMAHVYLCAYVHEGVSARGRVRGRAYAHVYARVRAQM